MTPSTRRPFHRGGAGPACEVTAGGGGVDGAAGAPDEPRAQVADIARSLDFYLALGCEVLRAADGWALLSCGEVSFVLTQAPGPTPGGGSCPRNPPAGHPWVRLKTPEVRTLRRRLLRDGVPTSVVIRPADTPGGEIVVIDPDERPVLITQPGPCAAHRAPRARDQASWGGAHHG